MPDETAASDTRPRGMKAVHRTETRYVVDILMIEDPF